jgi:TusA-related sulfurtransferase
MVDSTSEQPVQDSFAATMDVCYEVLLYLNSRMSKLKPGEVMEFLTPDPNAIDEIPAWCELRGYQFLSVAETESGQWRYLIQK